MSMKKMKKETEHLAMILKQLNNRNTLPKSTCLEQSYAQKKCDEANGVNGLHPEDQSHAEIMMQKKGASSSHSKDDQYYIDDDDEEDCNGDIPDECAFVDRIADDILENRAWLKTEGNGEEAILAPPSQTESSLPLKFRFENEMPKEVEKTDHEKEKEGLFSELDDLWAFGELKSSNYDEVDEEDKIPPAEETHLDRCYRGKHVLVLIDDEGLICSYCQFVALGPKEIIPDWVS